MCFDGRDERGAAGSRVRVGRLFNEPREWACWGGRLRLSEVAWMPNILGVGEVF